MNEKTSIIVVEYVRRFHTHQAFNASLLMSCHAAFPSNRIVMAAFQDHLDSIQELIRNVDWLTIEPLDPLLQAEGKKTFSNVKLASAILKLVSQFETDRLILTSITNPLLLSWRFLSLINLRLSKTLAFFHSGLTEIARKRRYPILAKLSFARLAVLNSPRLMQFIVLEPSILEELSRVDPKLSARFKVFPHPLPLDLLNSPNTPIRKSLPIRLGLLGLATPQKGLINFIELAKIAAENFPGRFEFEIIGRIHEDYLHLTKDCIQYMVSAPEKNVLPRHEFISRMQGLDFAVFLFKGSHYNFTASGVLLDCIAMGLPVIANPNPLINQITKEIGPIGLLCDHAQKHQLLERLLYDVSVHDRLIFQNNLKKLAYNRHPVILADSLRCLLD